MRRIQQMNGYYSKFGWTLHKPEGLRKAKRSDLEGRTIVSAEWLDYGVPVITLDDGRQIVIGVLHRVVRNHLPTEEDTGADANNIYDLKVAITNKPVRRYGRGRLSPYERRKQIEEAEPFPKIAGVEYDEQGRPIWPQPKKETVQ